VFGSTLKLTLPLPDGEVRLAVAVEVESRGRVDGQRRPPE